MGCIEGIFYELCEISSLGFSVPVYSVPFIPLLPHYPANISASAFYWMDCILNGGSRSRQQVKASMLSSTRLPKGQNGKQDWQV